MIDKIKVLIVDNSAVVRHLLTAMLSQDPGIAVIGSVPDPILAMERMNKVWPDVIVLDVEMPLMGGIAFLKKLMSIRPTPVVVCSTSTEKDTETTLQAISAGAIGVVAKPKIGLKDFVVNVDGDLLIAVKSAALVDMQQMKAVKLGDVEQVVPLQTKTGLVFNYGHNQ